MNENVFRELKESEECLLDFTEIIYIFAAKI